MNELTSAKLMNKKWSYNSSTTTVNVVYYSTGTFKVVYFDNGLFNIFFTDKVTIRVIFSCAKNILGKKSPTSIVDDIENPSDQLHN